MKMEILSKDKYTIAEKLLKEIDLPYEDINYDNITMFSFSDAGKVVGIGAFEQYGKDALLRSVAIDHNLQSRGVGSGLVRQIEAKAIESGITKF